jgi:hypothetical protein
VSGGFALSLNLTRMTRSPSEALAMASAHPAAGELAQARPLYDEAPAADPLFDTAGFTRARERTLFQLANRA